MPFGVPIIRKSRLILLIIAIISISGCVGTSSNAIEEYYADKNGSCYADLKNGSIF
jgi:cytochrome c biogenesis protein ResB